MNRSANPFRAPLAAVYRIVIPVLMLTSGAAPAADAGQDGSLFNDLKFDIDIRTRIESNENIRDLDSRTNAPDDDGWLITRIRPGVDWKPAAAVEVYLQGQDSREFFSGRPHDTRQGANGDESFDLRQGYLALGGSDDSPVELTLGRQPLAYGSSRILADSNWSNYGRTFDAVRLGWKPVPDWQVDAFAARVVRIEEDRFNDSDHHSALIGIYASGKISGSGTLDLYALHLDSTHSPTAGVKGDFWTLGSRLYRSTAAVSRWDWEIESVVQSGHLLSGGKDLDLLAFGTQATLGYTWQDVVWTPRVSLNYSYATGDRDSTDGDMDRLQPVYPSTHAPNSLLDVIGWANLHNPYLEAKVSPTKDMSLVSEFHAFFRASTDDLVYRANGSTPLRAAGTASADRYVGAELDLYMKERLSPNATLLAGAGIFFPGDYLRATGPSDRAFSTYLQIEWSY